jgi:hypothetical protein
LAQNLRSEAVQTGRFPLSIQRALRKENFIAHASVSAIELSVGGAISNWMMKSVDHAIRAIRGTVFSLAAISLAGCYATGSQLNSDATNSTANVFPTHYKSDLLAFYRTYLNDPTRVRDAGISEPMLKDFGPISRYIVCVRYNARKTNGEYAGSKVNVAIYLGGKFSQLGDPKSDACATVAYQPFPELERLTR